MPHPIAQEFKWIKATTYVTPVADGIPSDSAAMCADGRVCYMWISGSDIMQGWADNEESFFFNGSVKNAYAVMARNAPNVCVTNGPNGEGLYFTVAWSNAGSSAGQAARVEFWRSPSGNGGDWVLHGTIQNPGFPPEWSNWVQMGTASKNIGPIFVTAGGRWLVSAPEFRLVPASSGGPLIYKWQAVWGSDDMGATWFILHTNGFYIVGGPNGYWQCRNIGEAPDGTLWWASEGNPGENRIYRMNADGSGATWLYSYSQGTRAQFSIGDATYLYRVHNGGHYGAGNMNLHRSTNPSSNVWGDVIWGYSLERHWVILQKLKTRWALMSNGRLIRAMQEFDQIPPLRQRQRGDLFGSARMRHQAVKSRQFSERQRGNTYL